MTSYNLIQDFNEKCEFEVQTYNGISIIRETNSGYVNASQMCSSNNKRWRAFKTTNSFRELLEIYDEFILNTGAADGVKKLTPLKNAKKGVKPEFQGEYIHPKLVHFVAEYCSKRYAYMVSELMDSFNTSIHSTMKQQQLPDSVEVSKRLFEDLRDKAIKYNMLMHEQEEANKRANEHDIYCWCVRD